MASQSLLRSVRWAVAAWLSTSLFSSLPLSAANWPSWRGPTQDGVSPERNFPVKWSATENIRWRVDLPDRGNSSPIVWGDQVFITQTLDKEQRRTVMSFDRARGTLLWQGGVTFAGAEKTHGDNPYCAASPVTDGEVVVATFGSAGTVGYDLKGKLLWNRDLGRQEHEWGYASSPVLWKDLCFVLHGPGPQTRLVALDKRTGETKWQVPLPEPVPTERFDGFKGNLPGRIGSFATPLLINNAGREELVLALPEDLRSVSPSTGSTLWNCRGLNPLVYASPTWAEGVIVSFGGFFGSGLAVKPAGASGDITPARLWHEQRAKKNRLGSPIVHGGRIYVMNMDGTAECLELATGNTVWMERLKGPGPKADSWSSFTLAGDHLYTVNQSGDAFVVKAAPKFEIVAINSVGEYSNSTFAHSNGELFLRTWKGLWCISQTPKTASLR